MVPTRITTPTHETRVVNGRTFIITLDGSEWFDESGYANGADPAGLLEHLERVLVATQTPTAWLDVVADIPTPAVIWRRVLAATAQNPILATELGPLDQLVPALASPALGSELAKVVAAQFASAHEDVKRGVEATVLSLGTVGEINDEANYYRDQLYRQLLHALDRDAVSEETGAAIDTTTRPVEHTSHLGGAMAYDPNYGTDLSDPADKRVAELFASIRPFVHAHFNDSPGAEELEALSSAVDELDTLVTDGYAGVLAKQALEVLTEVAVIWTRLTREVGGHLHQRARTILLSAVSNSEPEPRENDDSGHKLRTIQTGPRNNAARGLPTLADPRGTSNFGSGRVLAGLSCLRGLETATGYGRPFSDR